MSGVKPTQDFAFFCDESSISGDRFTAVGGICVHRNTIDKIHKNMADYRELQNMKAELKWTKVSNGRYKEYVRFVEHFFAMNNINQIHFHSIIFDNTKGNLRSHGSKDKGIYNLYYQLIHHRFSKRCAPKGSLFVCMDYRHSQTSLNDMRDLLNEACEKEHGIKTKPIKEIVSADSKNEIILQINDVILGAISAVKNGKHILATTRDAKRNLAAMVLAKTGLKSYDENTHPINSKFSIWNLEL